MACTETAKVTIWRLRTKDRQLEAAGVDNELETETFGVWFLLSRERARRGR